MIPAQSEWQLEKQIDIGELYSLPAGPADQEKELTAIASLLASDSLTSHLQPIFSARSGKVFGYEALLRIEGDNPFGSIADIFRRAIATGCISALDTRCLETAVMTAHRFALHEEPVALFINVCPETLMNPCISFEGIDRLVELLGFRKEQIILEITEESVISNYEFFRESLAGFRRKGYKVAIDDFGAGYCGLKMLSTIEPDFVKIDRHFISGIDRALVKFNLVDAIAMACHRIGIRVVGEGVERAEELRSLMNTGIELFQGHLLGIPSCEPVPRDRLCPHFADGRGVAGPEPGELRFIGDIAVQLTPLTPDASIGEAFKRFTHDPGLKGLPLSATMRLSAC
ncbi:MAG: EAL domain-containing protein [Geobacteraceae bacterium]|nr:EAL domain-containing protein [Geobacteraceae bacterium]